MAEAVGASVEAGRVGQVTAGEAVHRDAVLGQELVEVGVLREKREEKLSYLECYP